MFQAGTVIIQPATKRSARILYRGGLCGAFLPGGEWDAYKAEARKENSFPSRLRAAPREK